MRSFLDRFSRILIFPSDRAISLISFACDPYPTIPLLFKFMKERMDRLRWGVWNFHRYHSFFSLYYTFHKQGERGFQSGDHATTLPAISLGVTKDSHAFRYAFAAEISSLKRPSHMFLPLIQIHVCHFFLRASHDTPGKSELLL